MEKIIDPISPELLKAELTEDKKIRNTNRGGNELYVITAQDSPNVLREIGRLREIAFRAEGGGSGLSMDLDEFDTMENPYKQIVVWDPDAGAILGGYRYILGPDVQFRPDGQPILATAHMFRFSEEFIRDYLPHVMELGRSFVAVEYQSSKAGAKALFALDNLWDGIATVAVQHSQIMYAFGKMTMYPSYDKLARDLILHFLWKHFPDPEELVRPIDPVMPGTDGRLLDLILRDTDFKSDYRNLKDAVRRLGSNIPPLVNSYMNTSPTMKMFGTAINDTFSDVEETGIMVCFDEMYAEKIDRHIKSYYSDRMIKLRERFPKIAENIDERLLNRHFERQKKVSLKFWNKKKDK
ncbi:MAG: GNAT family N-acetyltransferase [Bacteroidales bacterium]|nr:GNAT family N-acetyltransferase [Bacteroidales bacterium]